MKSILILAIALIPITTLGQTYNLKVPLVTNVKSQTNSTNDTIPKVIYVNKNGTMRGPAYYLNGQFGSETIMRTINPNTIENIKVVKEGVKVQNQKYFGQILITTKNSYRPKLISLNNLKLKYTDLKNTSTIFMIDNEIINEDYDKCMVDEYYILSISVENIDNGKESLKFNLINILTKTEENIKKSKEIILRGEE